MEIDVEGGAGGDGGRWKKKKIEVQEDEGGLLEIEVGGERRGEGGKRWR